MKRCSVLLQSEKQDGTVVSDHAVPDAHCNGSVDLVVAAALLSPLPRYLPSTLSSPPLADAVPSTRLHHCYLFSNPSLQLFLVTSNSLLEMGTGLS